MTFEEQVREILHAEIKAEMASLTSASRIAAALAPRVAAAIRAASNDNWPEDAALAALRDQS